MKVITRFAPSPTGLLHIGNIRTALLCFLIAKAKDGQFLLRLDDTDQERSTEEYSQHIKDDLHWLGLPWDRCERQSQRRDRYQTVIELLKEKGRLYPCYETPQELEIKRKLLLGRGLPPIYDRNALSLTAEAKQHYHDQGKRPYWRFKLQEKEQITWHDLIKGTISMNMQHISDPVLIREDGSPTYMLPSTVDDMDFGITHVVRGEDHLTNTAIQNQLFAALNTTAPQFAHHPLVKAKEGKISKRKGGFDITTLRAKHIEPMAIHSLLARLGSSLPIEPQLDMETLIRNFDLSIFTSSAATYDMEVLEKLNEKLIHLMPYSNIAKRKEMAGIEEAFWLHIRSNLHHIAEIETWKNICYGTIDPVIEDHDYTALAIQFLPVEPWNQDTWQAWTQRLKEHTKRKGKALFMPLRKALTGLENGPELGYLLPLMGYKKVLARLQGKKA